MKPNVLLVSLDTLRSDVAFSGRFPTLERLRREGSAFPRTISSAPLTPVSHASVLTGLHPPGHGIRHLLRERLRPDVPTVASRLRDAGLRTGAVVSCPGLNRWYGMDRGFDHYDDEIPRLADGRDPLKVVDVKIRGTALKRAPLVVERALRWVESLPSGRPFFLFAHFFDAHWPYEPPEDHGIAVANPYEGEVAFMDHYLGRLLDGLAALGHSLDDTVLICFSDHGEDLGGWYPNDHAGEQGHPEEEGHGCLLFDATQVVPLWIRAPGVPAGFESDRQVRLVDLAPTLADLLGLAAPEGDGASLLPLLAGGETAHRPAYSETFFPEERALADPEFAHLKALKAVRLDDRLKVIWEVGGDGVELYDLAADPLEKRPLPLGQGLVSGGYLAALAGEAVQIR